MDIALVTGADTPTGQAVCRRLIDYGCRVYALGFDFSAVNWQHPECRLIPCDLASSAEVREALEKITEREKSLFILVNAAFHAPREPLEALSPAELEGAVQVGLTTPLLATRLALPSLIRLHGFVINIAWNGKDAAPGGAAGAAIQGAVYSMGRALFEEVRDAGVKVCTLYPQPNAPAGADPMAAFRTEPQSFIDPERVGDAVEHILRFREGNSLTELVLQPQATREEPRIARVVDPLPRVKRTLQLPPADKYPEGPELIPTPRPQRPDDAPPPEAFEDFEEEDDDDIPNDERDLIARYTRGPGQSPAPRQRKQEDRHSHPQERRDDTGDAADTGKKKRRRRRGRGKRSRQDDQPRDEQRQDDQTRQDSPHPEDEPHGEDAPAPRADAPSPSPAEPADTAGEAPDAAPPAKKKAARKKAAKKKAAKKKTAAKKKSSARKKTAAAKKTAIPGGDPPPPGEAPAEPAPAPGGDPQDAPAARPGEAAPSGSPRPRRRRGRGLGRKPPGT